MKNIKSKALNLKNTMKMDFLIIRKSSTKNSIQQEKKEL
jgi:hypothetical protein